MTQDNLSMAFRVQIAAIVSATTQFGLHIAGLNSILPYMGCKGVESPGLDCIPGVGDGSLASSIFAIGGLVGSLCAGTISDAKGRRWTLLAGTLLALVGSLIIYLAKSLSALVLGRFLVGISSGQAIVVAPIFISELAPPNKRGQLGALCQISVNVGIVLVQLAGWIWAAKDFRKVLSVGVLAAFMSLILLVNSVESPVWLYSQKRAAEARNAANALGRGANNYEVSAGEESSARVSEGGFVGTIKEVLNPMIAFVTLPKYRATFILTAFIMSIQQFSGINAIVFYGVGFLADVLPDYSQFVNVLISALNLVVTIASAGMIDSLGRRPLLLISLSGMCLGTAAMAISLYAKISILAAISSLFTVAAFAVGLGPIPFLLISEYASPEIIGTAQSVATGFNWLATFTVGFLFPPLMNRIGDFTFLIFSLCSFVGVGFVSRQLPREGQQ